MHECDRRTDTGRRQVPRLPMASRVKNKLKHLMLIGEGLIALGGVEVAVHRYHNTVQCVQITSLTLTTVLQRCSRGVCLSQPVSRVYVWATLYTTFYME